MNDCMIIRGAITLKDGSEKTFRPATPSPDKHWAYMLMGQYSHLLNFGIRWVDNEPMVSITKSSHEESENAFNHIMDFARDNGLDVTWCARECESCKGHRNCLSGDSKMSAYVGGKISSGDNKE